MSVFKDGKVPKAKGWLGEREKNLTLYDPSIIGFSNTKLEKLWLLVRQISDTTFEVIRLDIAEDGSLYVNEVNRSKMNCKEIIMLCIGRFLCLLRKIQYDD